MLSLCDIYRVEVVTFVFINQQPVFFNSLMIMVMWFFFFVISISVIEITKVESCEYKLIG